MDDLKKEQPKQNTIANWSIKSIVLDFTKHKPIGASKQQQNIKTVVLDFTKRRGEN